MTDQERSDHELTNHKMTNEERLSIINIKKWQPFRIVWKMLHKDTGEFSLHSNTTKHSIRAAARAGHLVIQGK